MVSFVERQNLVTAVNEPYDRPAGAYFRAAVSPFISRDNRVSSDPVW
jgi:hypothetical protein